MAKVLVIDDDKMMCGVLEKIVQRLGNECESVNTIVAGHQIVAKGSFDIVLLDVQLPDGSGLDLLPNIRKLSSSPEVIIITSAGCPDGAELAIKNGAWDYIEKPFSSQDISRQIDRAISYRTTKQPATTPVVFKRDRIIGDSFQMQQCIELLAKASATSANILITGETGTGKELCARAIHNNSKRSDKPFIVVDCAAIPGTLIESLLFGSKKGAFTGADKDNEGLIKQADGGTLFLDEVGELPLDFQKAFLRVLQELRFRPLGAKQEVKSDFRVVAATNRNLVDMVEQGDFRSDLLFRLQTITVSVPSLRERPDDIKELTRHYVAKHCEQNGIGIKGLSVDLLDALQAYRWPGNVRELVNALESVVTTGMDSVELVPMHLPERVRIDLARSAVKNSHYDGEDRRRRPRYPQEFPRLQQVREEAVDEAEKIYLQDLIALVDGNVKKACDLSGVARAQFYNLLKKHDLKLHS